MKFGKERWKRFLRIFRIFLRGLSEKRGSEIQRNFAEISNIALDQMRDDNIPNEAVIQAKELFRILNKTNDDKIRNDIIFDFYDLAIPWIAGAELTLFLTLLLLNPKDLDLFLKIAFTLLIISIPTALIYRGIRFVQSKHGIINGNWKGMTPIADLAVFTGYFSILFSVWHIAWYDAILLLVVTILLFGVYIVFIRFIKMIDEGRKEIKASQQRI